MFDITRAAKRILGPANSSMGPKAPVEPVPATKPEIFRGVEIDGAITAPTRVFEWVPNSREFFPYTNTCVCGHEVPSDRIIDECVRPCHWVLGKTYCLHKAGYK